MGNQLLLCAIGVLGVGAVVLVALYLNERWHRIGYEIGMLDGELRLLNIRGHPELDREFYVKRIEVLYRQMDRMNFMLWFTRDYWRQRSYNFRRRTRYLVQDIADCIRTLTRLPRRYDAVIDFDEEKAVCDEE